MWYVPDRTFMPASYRSRTFSHSVHNVDSRCRFFIIRYWTQRLSSTSTRPICKVPLAARTSPTPISPASPRHLDTAPPAPQFPKLFPCPSPIFLRWPPTLCGTFLPVFIPALSVPARLPTQTPPTLKLDFTFFISRCEGPTPHTSISLSRIPLHQPTDLTASLQHYAPPQL